MYPAMKFIPSTWTWIYIWMHLWQLTSICAVRPRSFYKSQRNGTGQLRHIKPALSGTSICSLHSTAVKSSAVSSPERRHIKVLDGRRGPARYRSSVQGVWTASIVTVQSVYSRGTVHSPKCYYTRLCCDSIVRTQDYLVPWACAGLNSKWLVHWEPTPKENEVSIYCILSP